MTSSIGGNSVAFLFTPSVCDPAFIFHESHGVSCCSFSLPNIHNVRAGLKITSHTYDFSKGNFLSYRIQVSFRDRAAYTLKRTSLSFVSSLLITDSRYLK